MLLKKAHDYSWAFLLHFAFLSKRNFMKKNCLLTLIIMLVTPTLFGAARARLVTAPRAATVAVATSVSSTWESLVDTYLRKSLKPRIDALYPGGHHSPEHMALSMAITGLLNNQTRHVRGSTRLTATQIQHDYATVKLLRAALEGPEGVFSRIAKTDKTNQCIVIKRCLDECAKPTVHETFNNLERDAEQQRTFRGLIDEIVGAPLTPAADATTPTAPRITPGGGAAAAAAAVESLPELPLVPETGAAPAASGAEADIAALFASFN